MSDDRAKLLEEKAHSIGGTDASVIALNSAGKPAAFGRTWFDTWLRLTKRAEPQEPTDRMEMGSLMEEPVARRFSRRTGLEVATIPQVTHPSFPWYTGHIDRAIVTPGKPGDLECKTVEWDPLNEWSQPGEEQRVPIDYLLQVVWYVGLPRDGLGAFERMMYAAAQFGLSGGLRIYSWDPRKDERIKRIHSRTFEACQRFWEEYVAKDTPPPMPTFDGDAARRWLEFRHPSAKDDEIRLVSDTDQAAKMLEIAKAYREAKAKAKLHDAEADRLGAEIAAIVGDSYGATAICAGEQVKATWPSIEAVSKPVTDYQAILQEKGIVPTDDEIQRHTRIVQTRSGYRRLTVSVKPAGGR